VNHPATWLIHKSFFLSQTQKRDRRKSGKIFHPPGRPTYPHQLCCSAFNVVHYVSVATALLLRLSRPVNHPATWLIHKKPASHHHQKKQEKSGSLFDLTSDFCVSLHPG
jgi:hypothetical protein